MSRYIDADALPRHGNRGGLVHWKDIKEQPTADVVEVVRCRDCQFYGEFSMKCNKYHFAPIEGGDYCSYGEREEQ